MKGSIKRNPKTGTWLAVVDLPLGLNARRRQKRLHARTRRELELKIAETISAAQNGTLPAASKMTICQLLDEWLAIKKPHLAYRTYKSYEDQTRLYLKPALGHWLVAKLPSAIIQKAIQKWESEPTYDRKDAKRSARTINYALTVLSMAMKYASRTLKLRIENPVNDVLRPKGRKRKALHVFADDAGKILKALLGTALFVPIWLAFTDGLRRGEIVGLERGHVNLETGILSIRQAAVAYGGVFFMDVPKSAKSVRDLPMPSLTQHLLKQYLIEQETRLGLLGVDVSERTALFDRGDGLPWHPDAFASAYRQKLKTKQLRRLPLHGTRHSYASIAADEGVDRSVVRDTLGHKSSKLTSEVYTHVSAKAMKAAAETLATTLAHMVGIALQTESQITVGS